MTTLTQYLDAERIDLTEPLGFYVPGGDDLSEEHARSAHRGRKRPLSRYDRILPEDVDWGEE